MTRNDRLVVGIKGFMPIKCDGVVIITEERLKVVKTTLEENSDFGVTVSEVSGRGKQKWITLQ